MKFVDEAHIEVKAGKGGDGCLSFRRERCIPLGGPDGGDGGDGGSVYLVANHDLNTLVDFRHHRHFRGSNGQPGMGRQRTGRRGEDCHIEVPAGTLVYDDVTGELIGDLAEETEPLLVAQGGYHGIGNIRFKSSTNRAPRKTTKGSTGEERTLFLELQLLADVGLAGLPNAGKSTFIRRVSAAKPKVADYPFTTLYPNLGVVSVEVHRSFVIADIPGLIEGAADGAGLGIQFLKHLNRTRLLLHLVDMFPLEASDNPVAAIQTVQGELRNFSADLYAKERWLVLNKADLGSNEQQASIQKTIVEALHWQGPVFCISSVTGEGCKTLVGRVQTRLTELQLSTRS